MTGGLPETPWIEIDRLLIVATGSASASFLPYWTNLLHFTHPELECRIVVTRSAERFVTQAALAAASGGEVLADAWPEQHEATAAHEELAEWAQGVLVYPASFHFVARLALGLADTPSLLAAQCTTAPIVLAPSVPPGATDSPAYRAHVAALGQRPNVVVADTYPGRSLTTGRDDARVSAPLPEALVLLEACRRRLRGEPPPAEEAGAAGQGAGQSATAKTKVLVPERGTSLRRSAVLTADEPGRCYWVRWPGPDAPCGFTEVQPQLRERLSSVGTQAGSRLVVGEDWHDARRYPMPAPQSVAEQLISSRGEDCAQHAPAVAELGRLVRQLHDLGSAPVEHSPQPPPALGRLRGWLDGPALSEQHGSTREVVRDRLGARRWSLLADWLEGLLDRREPLVVAHGWLGLGQCAADPGGGVALVVGEDLGCAPWQVDAGWVAGQLLELRHFLGTDETRGQFDELLSAWWAGYGRSPDERAQRAAILDIALHLNDFSAYFTVGEGEPVQWADLLVSLIDETEQ